MQLELSQVLNPEDLRTPATRKDAASIGRVGREGWSLLVRNVQSFLYYKYLLCQLRYYLGSKE